MWKPEKYDEELRAAAFRKGLLGGIKRGHKRTRPFRDTAFEELKNHPLVELGAEGFCNSLHEAIIDLHPKDESGPITTVDLGSKEFEEIGRWLFGQYFKTVDRCLTLPREASDL